MQANRVQLDTRVRNMMYIIQTKLSESVDDELNIDKHFTIKDTRN